MTPEEFAVRRRALSDRASRSLEILFLGLKAWRDADQKRFIQHAIPTVRGGQNALASLTGAWIAQQAGAAIGKRIAPPRMPQSAVMNLRRGIDDNEVYKRPFRALYTALSKGSDFGTALESGNVRLKEILEFDLQQTYAHASQTAMQELPSEARARFWRRELIGPENCAMCVLASTQRYRVEDLNPIHPGCNCEVAGIFGDDPGHIIAPELLDKVHVAVEQLLGTSDRGGREVDYRHLTAQITAEHGELGTVLVRPGDHFTGPDDL